jgi:hypothetical protein
VPCLDVIIVFSPFCFRFSSLTNRFVLVSSKTY